MTTQKGVTPMSAPLTRRSVLALGAGAAIAAAAGPSLSSAAPGRGEGQYLWDNVAIGGGGYLPGMIAHPKVEGLFYAKADVGTPYRWDARSERWIPLLNWVTIDEWWRSTAESIAIDPSETSGQTVYVAVGKYDGPGSGDVWKSTDRGSSWRRTNLPVRVEANGSHVQLYDGRLTVDPLNGQVVYYASARDGLWRTVDGAQSWQQISTQNGCFLRFDPTSGTVGTPRRTRTCYLGASLDEGTSTGVLCSTDGGDTWVDLAGPSNPRRAAVDQHGNLYLTHSVGVAKWDGSAWANISPTAQAYGGLAIDPSNPDHVLVARREATGNLDIYQSTNAGQGWQKIIKTQHDRLGWVMPRNFAAAIASIVFNPFNPSEVWFTDWYNAYRTSDINAPTVVFEQRWEGHEEVVPVGPLVSSPEASTAESRTSADSSTSR